MSVKRARSEFCLIEAINDKKTVNWQTRTSNHCEVDQSCHKPLGFHFFSQHIVDKHESVNDFAEEKEKIKSKVNNLVRIGENFSPTSSSAIRRCAMNLKKRISRNGWVHAYFLG